MVSELSRTVVAPEGVAKPLGSYAHAVRVRAGELVFIAGQVAVDESGALVGPGDFATQLRQVFQNLGRVLASVGASFENVAQFTTYLTHSQDVDPFMAVRGELLAQLYPNGGYPPNTLLIINRLVREEFLVEIEAIAALP